MNLLPKKSWHVRTKKNIERIRRDEEEARVKQELEQQRYSIADQEALLELLKRRDGTSQSDAQCSTDDDIYSRHVNLFPETSQHATSTNKEHEYESKRDELLWQSKIGLLNRLAAPADVANPWYCKDRLTRVHSDKMTREMHHMSNRVNHDTLAHNSKYHINHDTIHCLDPLLRMQVAQEIIKTNEQLKNAPLQQQPDTRIPSATVKDVYTSKAHRGQPSVESRRDRYLSDGTLEFCTNNRTPSHKAHSSSKEHFSKREERHRLEEKDGDHRGYRTTHKKSKRSDKDRY